MIPILFNHDETFFNTNGLGRLSDAISCFVTEERNGSFELEMSYPIDGIHYADIAQRCIIFANTSAKKIPQPFRIYRMTKPKRGIVDIYAHHISYDLSGIPVGVFESNSAADTMANIATHSIVANPFSFWTDKTTQGTFKIDKPCSLRSVLGGSHGSIIDAFGGEYEFDKFTVKLFAQRGVNNGVSIRYGKNLIDLTQEENCANCFTGVFAFWVNDSGTMIQSDVISAGTFDYTKVFVLDCSQDYEEQPTKAQLNEKAQSYISKNSIGVPKVSIDVSFAQIENTQEYKDNPWLETVNLCDFVNVQFDKLGISATAKVVKTIYDVLNDRYSSVEVGDAKTNIADTISKQQYDLNHIEIPEADVTRSMMQEAIETATKAITGNNGGYIVLHDANDDGKPDELLIMDSEDIATATKVWRWNNEGLGYSGTGYSGTYGTAITADGSIVANYITSGQLTANIIKTGAITNILNNFKIDLDGGKITITGTKTYTNADYTAADVRACSDIVLGKALPTAAQLEKYDTNNTGNLTITNVVQVEQFSIGNIHRLDITWKVELSPADGLVISKSGKRDNTTLPPIEMLRIAGNAGAFTSVTTQNIFTNGITTDKMTLGSSMTMYAPNDAQTARANLYMRSDNKAELIVDKLTVRDGVAAVFG